MSTIVGLYFNSPIETGGANALTGLRSGTMVEPIAWVTSTYYPIGALVSSSGNAYSCNMAHTSGATLAADSAKWDSLGVCSQTPAAVIGTVYTIYFRAVDTTTNSDPGQDSTTNAVFMPPANSNVQVSADGSTGWVSYPSTLTLSVKVTGGNQPVYVKQTSGVSSSPGALGIDALSWTAGTRVAQVGTVTASPGDSSVSLSWADISSETGYEVDRATNSGFTANLVHLTTSLAANSTSYVNNSTNGNAPVNGTTYYYRVRGVNANGVGAWSSGVSATPNVQIVDTLQPDGTAGIDTGIDSYYPTANYAVETLTVIGDGSTVYNDARRMLIKFTLPDYTGKTIISAQLVLQGTVDLSGGKDPATLYLHRVLRDWSEAQATWNIYSTGNNWQGYPNGPAFDNSDVKATESASVVKAYATGVQTYTFGSNQAMIDDLNAQIAGTSFGWIIRSDAENAGVSQQRDDKMYTSDYVSVTSRRPKLIITTVNS